MDGNKPKKRKGRTENLIPFNQLTEEERRKMASKAGKASVIARRKKKDMREQVKEYLQTDVPIEQKTLRAVMKNMGVKPEDMDYSMAIISMMVKEAAKGNVRAAIFLRDTAGFMPDEKVNVSAEVKEKSDVVIYLPAIESDEEDDEEEFEEDESEYGDEDE